MAAERLSERLRTLSTPTVTTALGREHRADAVLPGGGGPAGNARLTAWTGLALLALFVAELLTLFDVRGLITWHLLVGAVLVPPVVVKTATTGWRILRYYVGDRHYRAAGPPPLLLRVLGPLVIVMSVGVLASGLVLVWIGPDASRRVLVQLLGQRVDAITVHQALFAGWAVVTGLHVLGRFLPALQLSVLPPTSSEVVPGRGRRAAVLVVTAVSAAVVGAVVVAGGAGWRSQSGDDHRAPDRGLAVDAQLTLR